MENTVNVIAQEVGLPTKLQYFKRYLVDSEKIFKKDPYKFGGGDHSLIDFP